MIIKDDDNTFDTELILKYARSKVSMSEKDYDAAYKLIRKRYGYIRNMLDVHCCSIPEFAEIKKLLINKNNIKRVISNYGYTKEEIEFYMSFTESFNTNV
ncbi:hypothetical protein LABALGNA3A7_09670 [Dellaglioa algida]|nr:hypothetical protein LABALGNA3A7_09670 [Dellaglioa algida]